MREIVIDTETTGLDPNDGHRIVEIACVELMHHVPTGRKFHCYLNPGRDMPEDALAVHGLTAEFLASQPAFEAIADEFATFIADDRLVIHNAEFDLAFINAELARLGRPALACALVDTLAVARRRFAIDLTAREKHGADIDCGLLAAVYVELLGGRQPGLDFAAAAVGGTEIVLPQDRPPRPARPHAASIEELAAHQAMLAAIKMPLWLGAA